jgi:hypothetical protein
VLVHFYHVYADGAFESPVRDHFNALEESGLADALDSFRIGIVGSKENRLKALELFEELGIPFTLAALSETGWEQVTLSEVYKFSKTTEAKILYAHTKGSYSQTRLAREWRISMLYDTVTRWKSAVLALDTFEAAGPFWISSNAPEHEEHEFFFAGNFWWARTDYLRRLPTIKNETRYQAEGWIGLRSPSVKIMRNGYPDFNSFWKPAGK